MIVTTGAAGREDRIAALFQDTFAASEGADEGALIGALATNLMSEAAAADIRVFCAEEGDELIGAAIFSPLTFVGSDQTVMLLSPMAVSPKRQKQGVGQALLTHALAALRDTGVDIAITYGDPNYYSRVGFHPIREADAPAPLPLSFPHGWIGQSLKGGDMPRLTGPSTCVPALDRADIW